VNSILVTGGAGFIGHHLVNRLVHEGYSVVIIDNFSSANTEFKKRVESDNRIKTYVEDIRNRETVADIVKREKIDTCIHLAAKTSVMDSIKNPFETADVNVAGTLALLEACVQNNVDTFVFASSAAVYGNPRFLPISEDHVLDPISPYGASKVAGEMLVLSYGKAEKISNAVSLRFFNVYGEGQSTEYAGVISRFAERLARRLPPIIYGDGKQTRDFVFVDDVTNALMLAAGSKATQTLNVGTGKPITIEELAVRMISKYGYNMPPIYREGREGEILNSYANIDKAVKLLGFLPKVGLDEGLTRFIFQPTRF
jgi:UDP-glucose 4-epimerase